MKQEEVKTIQTQRPDSKSSSSKLVLVVGGTGGVGQLVVASLLDRNIKSRLLLRDPLKAENLFGQQDENTLKVLGSMFTKGIQGIQMIWILQCLRE